MAHFKGHIFSILHIMLNFIVCLWYILSDSFSSNDNIDFHEMQFPKMLNVL